jgi:type II secretory pathway pseudopilin PulG
VETRAGLRARLAGEEGLTILEVLVAIAIIGIVMTSLTSFFVTSLAALNAQSNRQSAVQVADEATERVRALKATSIVGGRGENSAKQQWSAPVTGAAGYLADSVVTWDPAATKNAGADATLPTVTTATLVGGVTYGVTFYVGNCWQQEVSFGDHACGTDNFSGYVEFLRVVVAVTWRCHGTTCSYLTSTLVNAAADPLFNSHEAAQPPQIADSTQTSDVATTVSTWFTASGGTPPLVWSATGLPPGLTLNSSGLVTGAPSTAGTYPATVAVTDAWDLSTSATVTWRVNPLPTLTTPSAQTGEVGVAGGNLQVVVSGGTSPYAWSASGLPPGLSIAAGTGVISGTPGTAGSYPVTVTVTDALDASATTASFTWTVAARPAVSAPTASQSTAPGTAVNLPASVTGGVAPYAWSAAGLPPGLSINSGSGQITGSTGAAGGPYQTTLTVTDAKGVAATSKFNWTVK